MVMNEYNITDEVIFALEEPIVSATLPGVKALVADNWFKLFPEKVLGVPYQSSGKYGEVTKYKGTIKDVERIDAPDNFIGNMKSANDPLASSTFDINPSAEVLKPDVEAVVNAAIEGAEKEAKQLAKKKLKKVDETALVKPVGEIKSFRECFDELNPNMSMDEVEAYVWYKTKIGKPLSKYYVSLFKPEFFSEDEVMTETYPYTVPNETIESWVRNGLLFYSGGELLPAVEYLQGNMYERKLRLDADEEYIKTTYGEDVFNKQAKILQDEKYFGRVKNRRVSIGLDENSLVILPTSKLASEFKISTIESLADQADIRFKIKKSKRAEDFGQPDIYLDRGVYDYQRTYFDEITLVDAFKWWVLNKTPLLKLPVSYIEILQHYIDGKRIPTGIKDSDTPEVKKEKQAKAEKFKSDLQAEGKRLFAIFLDSELVSKDRIRLETLWNVDNNNYLGPDYNRIPVAFRMMKNEKVREEKRDAVAFTLNNGTGVLSYDVGVGKTPSAIFSMSAFMDAGYCRRPLVVVPNQVYRQFISEIKLFTPHIPINEAYNLSKEYAENFMNNKGEITFVPNGTITVMTYEGFRRIGFGQATQDELLLELFNILDQGGDYIMTEKEKASKIEKMEKLIGVGIKGTLYDIENFGFDYICFDEAHKMKKVFTTVKGETDEQGDRGRSGYEITSGTPSSIGLKGFMIAQYILKNNDYKNILLLTATPFTNSPLEIFSVLAFVGYEQLKKNNMNNLKNFFDTYVQASTQLTIDSKLKPVIKEVFLGFNNLIAMQSLIYRFILYKTGDDIAEVRTRRPKKYVLPYLKEIENGVTIRLPEDKKIDTYLSMSDKQQAMMADIIAYVEEKVPLPDYGAVAEDLESVGSSDVELEEGQSWFANDNTGFTIVSIDEDFVKAKIKYITANGTDKKQTEVTLDSLLEKIGKDAMELADNSVEADMELYGEDEKNSVRTIKGLNYSRNLALSPYLYPFSGMRKPTYKQYIETSPKLMYVMGCIKSVKEYHESKGEIISGQVIYMDRGIKYFPLIKEYLVKEIGYKENEVGIIQSGMKPDGLNSKEYIKNLFNGEIYNEQTKDIEKVSDDKRIKVVIGSSTIKEGINLQKYGTVLYNCFLDWNPTDLQQLTGRIFRQGNKYKNVRIVNPLVIDSADIFIFQKLEEKTSRLNSIWSTDGKTNVLKTQEFSPEELKYALIRNPVTIAELKIIEQKGVFQSEILGLNRQLEIVRGVTQSVNTIKRHKDDLIKKLYNYRNFNPTGDFVDDTLKLVQLANDATKNATDKFGKKIISLSERKYAKPEVLEKVSELTNDKFYRPYFLTDLSVSAKTVKKFRTDYLDPFKIKLTLDDADTTIQTYIDSIKNQISDVEDRIKQLQSPEYKEQVVREVLMTKEENKITYTTVEQSVRDFGRLNYLLSETKEPLVKVEATYNTCPPLNADGTRSIEKEAMAYLEKCLKSQPQTKSLHYNPETGYDEKRKKLHDKILKNLFENVRCVTKGQPIAIFTGGSPASGKSTFISKNAEYLRSDRIFHLDADEIRAKLPEYEGWNANSTHEETQDIVNAILAKLGEGQCRYDFIYDGTMNKAKKYFPLIQKVKDMGYKTYIIFMDIPYEEAKRRSLARYQQTGRFVPMEVIDDFFTEVNGKSRGQAALDELKDMVDGYVVADGFTGEIKETGGEGIPRNRDEEVYGDKLKPSKIVAGEPAKVMNMPAVQKETEVIPASNVDADQMRRFNTIKGKYSDAIVLFRVGEFYETYGDDAIAISSKLDIPLTKRYFGKDSFIFVAGFPFHRLDQYMSKLTKAGNRVAIVDELESPKSAKVEINREPITPEKAKSIWTAFKRNEDDNDHTSNVVLLARNFGTEQDLANALEIQSRHNKEGHLTSELSKRRDEIQDRLYPELLRLIQPAVVKPAEKKPMGKAYITKTIDRLKVALKYAPNPDVVKKQIKTLEIALKYS